MVKRNQNLWEETLRLIKENVSEQQFNALFRPMMLESYDENSKTILVKIPSMFVYEYVEEHYADLLFKVLTRTFGAGVKLNYRVIADMEHGKTNVIESEPVPNIDSRRPRSGANESPTLLDAVKPQQIDSQLNTHLTFANFVEGASNKLPRTVGLSVAEHPATTAFNPMFIFGPSGCGKTHLINAIGVRAKELYPQKRILYVSARLFQVQYTNAVLKNSLNDFIRFYQTIDMLIVDDIQEWMSAAKTQDTFFHIFNHLFRNGKRIILACDRPPVDLKGMHERLLTRFACGLTAELEKPNEQLCIDILNRKIKHDGLNIPEEVVRYIAQTANGSVRDLEGVVNSLMAYSIVYNRDIDMTLAERVIKRAVKIDDKPLTVDEIVETVCEHFKVSTSAVDSRSRKREHVIARQVAMYLAQKHTKMPAARIGQLVGGRDHSTVIHSCSQVEKRISSDSLFNKEMAEIERHFKLKK
ncbi:MAG: chromosomal replication initiator protein DnaA [Prevotella sp.]|uniref:chromosomal replication initiator protein DnaA n=1 Tax=Prevotella sp. TaxID=59823 RepID=UPI002A2916C7|nr:chromosomal replication initiator protein DnaA [Prevotella sp.]MDD7317843.1 chromosomal replication initiator protein DnaA [Prevotellaceae bacterium]MDY4020758.1 chromosomal replication initiator protein DnaA [Prevotella sp.]